jgi:hypothetical protein
MKNRPLKTEMHWEWNWPYLYKYTQNLDIFSFDMRITHCGDHSPGFYCSLVICNLKLLDFAYYNIHHAPDELEVFDE